MWSGHHELIFSSSNPTAHHHPPNRQDKSNSQTKRQPTKQPASQPTNQPSKQAIKQASQQASHQANKRTAAFAHCFHVTKNKASSTVSVAAAKPASIKGSSVVWRFEKSKEMITIPHQQHRSLAAHPRGPGKSAAKSRKAPAAPGVCCTPRKSNAIRFLLFLSVLIHFYEHQAPQPQHEALDNGNHPKKTTL